MRTLALISILLLPPWIPPAQEKWELPPILYSKTKTTDPIARLAKAIASGESALPKGPENEVLRFLLTTLGIADSSQILVYSKTSAQNYFISPSTPRALYFNENAYVGHVLGGGFEIIVQDPQVGMAFYFIEHREGKYDIQRDTSSCLNCHATRRTESIPGLTVRSVPTDENGNLLLTLGTSRTDHRTPIGKRWAGFYVTGSSTLPHLGNRIFSAGDPLEPTASSPQPKDLGDRIDVSRYLRGTSDIVALMVLEHQCLVHNLINRVAADHRHAMWRESALGGGKENSGATPALPKIRELVDALLFKDEAPIGDTGVDGSADFQRDFSVRFPKTREGDSLADFHLANRIFKNRCSYMVYSEAFGHLPEAARIAVLRELRQRLENGVGWIPETERRRILRILSETVADF